MTPETKNDVAKRLAYAHFDIEPGITKIFKLHESPEFEMFTTTPIKLLEVNTCSSSSGVMPLHFGPAPASGIPYSSVIVEVTPAEYEQIKANTLNLPEGWRIGDEISRGGAEWQIALSGR